jgi:hypothetical protein
VDSHHSIILNYHTSSQLTILSVCVFATVSVLKQKLWGEAFTLLRLQFLQLSPTSLCCVVGRDPTPAAWSSGPLLAAQPLPHAANYERVLFGLPRVSPPQLCVAIVSCKRPKLLRRTLSALEAALAAEPGLTAEVHWVDNGTPAVERNALLDAFGGLITSAVLHDSNCGVFGALNLLYFTLCGAAP